MWLLPISMLVTTTILAIPLGKYLAWIMDGKYHPPRLFRWFEKRLDTGPQNWKQYTASLLIFNTVLFVFGYVVLSLQPWMPLNPQGKGMLAPTTILHSVISFMTNTDLQHYSGDVHFSNFSQIFFCITNFFLSASIGFCSLAAIIRAFRSDKSVGNFFVDMWRVVVYMFVPISFVLALLFLQQGTPMTYQSSYQVSTLEPAAMGTTDKGERQTTDHRGRSAGRVRADEAIGHQRRRLLRHELRPPLRKPDGLHQLPFMRRHDAFPVCAGVDVRPDAWPATPRMGHFLRDDGNDGGHDRLDDLV